MACVLPWTYKETETWPDMLHLRDIDFCIEYSTELSVITPLCTALLEGKYHWHLQAYDFMTRPYMHQVEIQYSLVRIYIILNVSAISILTESFSTIAAFPWNCCPSHVRHDASIWKTKEWRMSAANPGMDIVKGASLQYGTRTHIRQQDKHVRLQQSRWLRYGGFQDSRTVGIVYSLACWPKGMCHFCLWNHKHLLAPPNPCRDREAKAMEVKPGWTGFTWHSDIATEAHTS